MSHSANIFESQLASSPTYKARLKYLPLICINLIYNLQFTDFSLQFPVN